MKKFMYLLLGVTLLAGCGNTAGVEKENLASTANEVSTEDTNESLAGKELTVYSAGPDGLSEKIRTAFETETGIKVNLFQGTTGKILAKLEAEKSNPIADVLVLASIGSMDSLKQAGELQEYPDALGKEKLNTAWVDDADYYFPYSASALGIVYNTKNIETPPTDWGDLADSQWQDKFNMPDPTLSGSALDFVYGFSDTATGWETMESWYANGLQIMGANKEALDAVITGEKQVTLSGVDYMTYKAKAEGEPVDIVYPESGTVVSPRAVGITKSAKEVKAAQAFVDFLLSDQGQQLVANAYLLPGNSSFPVDNRATLAEIKQIDVAWQDSEKKQLEVLQQFTSLSSQ